MRRRSRFRRLLKWGGLVLSLLIAAIWVGSSSWTLGCQKANAFVALHRATFVSSFDSLDTQNSWRLVRLPERSVVWLPHFVHYRRVGPDYYRIQIPLWMLVLLFALPTAFLFWRDRRLIPPGHCKKCSYSLTGNTSGVCPECGTAVHSDTDVPAL
jgi:hypothetical protein